jgi:hypothetical protein
MESFGGRNKGKPMGGTNLTGGQGVPLGGGMAEMGLGGSK